MTTTLYRFYNDDGQLLYVGIAGNPARRFEQHAHEKTWWDDVRRVTVNHFDTREQAAVAEVAAIREERPLHNVVYNTQRPQPVMTRGGFPEVAATLRKDGYGVQVKCPFCNRQHVHGWGLGSRVAHCQAGYSSNAQYVLVPANEHVATAVERETERLRLREEEQAEKRRLQVEDARRRSVNALTREWGEVFDQLSPRTKARFRGGYWVELSPPTFALPTEIHRQRCEECRVEVEHVLGRHFQTQVSMRLVVG